MWVGALNQSGITLDPGSKNQNLDPGFKIFSLYELLVKYIHVHSAFPALNYRMPHFKTISNAFHKGKLNFCPGTGKKFTKAI